MHYASAAGHDHLIDIYELATIIVVNSYNYVIHTVVNYSLGVYCH